MNHRGWGLALAAASVLGLLSLASDATTMAQISAEANTVRAVRGTVSVLLNGTLWAGLAVLSGWLVRRPVQAAAAGVVALLAALVVHYGVGWLLGMFDTAGVLENSYWFEQALILGMPLGLVGAAARRTDRWGVMARLVIPVMAVLEPFVTRSFSTPSMMPWPQRFAATTSGVLLVLLGTAGCIWVLVVARKDQQAHGRKAARQS